jgi:hypothetical protein
VVCSIGKVGLGRVIFLPLGLALYLQWMVPFVSGFYFIIFLKQKVEGACMKLIFFQKSVSSLQNLKLDWYKIVKTKDNL